MLRARRQQVQAALVATDGVMTVAAFLAAYYGFGRLLQAAGLRSVLPVEEYGWVPALAVVMWWVVFAALGRYRLERIGSLREIARDLVAPMLLGALVIGFAIFIFKEKLFARRVIGSFLVLNYGLVVLGRAAVAAWARRLGPMRQLLLVGSGPSAYAYARAMADDAWGLEIVGYVAPSQADVPLAYAGAPRDLPRLLDEHVVDDVVLVNAPGGIADIKRTVAACELVGVSLHIDAGVFDASASHLAVEPMGERQLLSLTTTPHDPALLGFKRAMDVAVAGALLLYFWPLFLALAAAVKLSSRGPVLFVQERVGLNGRRFRLYKFRSMVEGAEAMRDGLADRNLMDGPVFKLADDPRVTPLGRLMRRFYLDELPQLWNVLRGDMSLVGPRPPLPSEVPAYERWQRRRLSMRPGLTGLWQVSGRHAMRFEEWMRCDLAYIDAWSPALDCALLLRTLAVVMGGKGI